MTLLGRAAFPALTCLLFQRFRLSPIVASYWTANPIGIQSILADSVGLEPRQQEIYKQTALPTRSIEIQCSACDAIPFRLRPSFPELSSQIKAACCGRPLRLLLVPLERGPFIFLLQALRRRTSALCRNGRTDCRFCQYADPHTVNRLCSLLKGQMPVLPVRLFSFWKNRLFLDRISQ